MDINRLADIEDLMIGMIRQEISDLPDERLTISTRTVPLTEEELKKMLGLAPFVYIEYNGGAAVAASEDGATRLTRHEYNVFVAAKSLRSQQEAQRGTNVQRGSYQLLALIFNALNGVTATDMERRITAGPFQFQSQAAIYVEPTGTVYQAVYSLIDQLS